LEFGCDFGEHGGGGLENVEVVLETGVEDGGIEVGVF
jgi:hypothetical protein